MTAQPGTAPVTRPSAAVAAGGLILAAIIAIAMNAAVAAIAHAAGASHDFRPLHVATYAALTVISLLAGAAGWAIIRARASNPRHMLRALVPVVLIISFVPDLLVGASATMPGTSWGAVAALMVMHLVVAAIAIPTYLLALPLPTTRR